MDLAVGPHADGGPPTSNVMQPEPWELVRRIGHRAIRPPTSNVMQLEPWELVRPAPGTMIRPPGLGGSGIEVSSG